MTDDSNVRTYADSLDDPPNSRLFLVTSKSTTEEVIREHFSVFGEIQDIWVVKDKHTKESKGVAFVKFAKSSQACKAMEDMHGKCLIEGTKPIKVFIAQSRSSGSHRDVEDEELTRIFIMIPKTFTEEDLKEKFKEYGDIEYCIVIRNKTTGESKGLGYVRYLKPSQAAMAIENCDRNYRAILAEPKNRTSASCENDYFSTPRSDHMSHDPGMNSYPFAEASNFGVSEMRGSDSITKCLLVSSRASLSQEQMFNLLTLFLVWIIVKCREILMDIIKVKLWFGIIMWDQQYMQKEKLHGFEYPPGNRLVLTYIEDGEEKSSPVGMMALQLVAAQMMSMVWSSPVGQQFMKTSSGYSSGSSTQMNRLQTDVSLPPHRKLAPADSRVKERLFIVFNPAPLSVDVLEDVFCRFGSLIEVYIVQGRNVGYIKFADRKSANEAMITLHGKVINGVKLKVMLADPPKEESHKRQRTY